MAGIPQVRESAWLCAPDDPEMRLAHVRLEERMDGSGWDLYLSDPASARSQHVRWPDEAGARAELERVYAEGRERGVWRVRRHGGY
ncbi:hypothetical protein ACGFIG_09250 [Micromonospora sp. NPDC049048]|uniref:hypothetical protein n=1 Tax=Micromonospora sp. NPDC049048 TaxID=3364263 RepID=UPI0037186401